MQNKVIFSHSSNGTLGRHAYNHLITTRPRRVFLRNAKYVQISVYPRRVRFVDARITTRQASIPMECKTRSLLSLSSKGTLRRHAYNHLKRRVLPMKYKTCSIFSLSSKGTLRRRAYTHLKRRALQRNAKYVQFSVSPRRVRFVDMRKPRVQSEYSHEIQNMFNFLSLLEGCAS